MYIVPKKIGQFPRGISKAVYKTASLFNFLLNDIYQHDNRSFVPREGMRGVNHEIAL